MIKIKRDEYKYFISRVGLTRKDKTDIGLILRGVKYPIYFTGKDIDYDGDNIYVNDASLFIDDGDGIIIDTTTHIEFDFNDILHMYSKSDVCITYQEQNVIKEVAERCCKLDSMRKSDPKETVEVEVKVEAKADVKSLFPF